MHNKIGTKTLLLIIILSSFKTMSYAMEGSEWKALTTRPLPPTPQKTTKKQQDASLTQRRLPSPPEPKQKLLPETTSSISQPPKKSLSPLPIKKIQEKSKFVEEAKTEFKPRSESKTVKQVLHETELESVEKFRTIESSSKLSSTEQKSILEQGDSIIKLESSDLKQLSPEEKLKTFLILRARVIQLNDAERSFAQISEKDKILASRTKKLKSEGNIDEAEKIFSETAPKLRTDRESLKSKFGYVSKKEQKDSLEKANILSRNLGDEFKLRWDVMREKKENLETLKNEPEKLQKAKEILVDNFVIGYSLIENDLRKKESELKSSKDRGKRGQIKKELAKLKKDKANFVKEFREFMRSEARDYLKKQQTKLKKLDGDIKIKIKKIDLDQKATLEKRKQIQVKIDEASKKRQDIVAERRKMIEDAQRLEPKLQAEWIKKVSENDKEEEKKLTDEISKSQDELNEIAAKTKESRDELKKFKAEKESVEQTIKTVKTVTSRFFLAR